MSHCAEIVDKMVRGLCTLGLCLQYTSKYETVFLFIFFVRLAVLSCDERFFSMANLYKRSHKAGLASEAYAHAMTG